MKIWNDINLPIQNKKLDSANIISNKRRRQILDGLSKRGYYLTRVAECFHVARIAEVGTAEGWQFYNFCKYVSEADIEGGAVFTCDPRNVRSEIYRDFYESDNRFDYTQGTSKEMSEKTNNIEMFYIDGLHDQGTVVADVINLEKSQSQNRKSVWIFDDFEGLE